MTPARPALPREFVAVHKRRRMMDAMAELTAERGYGATKIADVVSRAGVARKTLYDNFSGKEELFLAAFETTVVEARESVEAACATFAEADGEGVEAGAGAVLLSVMARSLAVEGSGAGFGIARVDRKLYLPPPAEHHRAPEDRARERDHVAAGHAEPVNEDDGLALADRPRVDVEAVDHESTSPNLRAAVHARRRGRSLWLADLAEVNGRPRSAGRAAANDPQASRAGRAGFEI